MTVRAAPSPASVGADVGPAARSGFAFGRPGRVRAQLRRSIAGFMGGVVLAGVVSVALLAPVLATHDPIANDLAERLRPPSRAHLFGTDDFGRDIWSRVVWGARVSLVVALIVVGIAAVGGAGVGVLSGYFGGRLDLFIMRVVDMILAFPALLLALAVMAGLGSSLLNVIVAVAVAFLPRFARVQRAVTLTVREREFVLAAVALGSSHWRILTRHVIPNCLAPVLVMMTVSAADAILVESSLSFLGLGVQPPAPTWGAVISDGRSFLQNAPWISGFSGAAIMITVLGLNLLGDGLRDLLDPTLRGEAEEPGR